MSLFKSNKNQSASAAASPAQTPRPSVDAQRLSAQATKMTCDQALELALNKAVQTMPAAFNLIQRSTSRREVLNPQEFLQSLVYSPYLRGSFQILRAAQERLHSLDSREPLLDFITGGLADTVF
ncbi:MAG: hypothetical protein J3R72DRAFT_529742 [Linnemannia gamsii]|nr:MAG: hypothetical protein J3R72DRAFT_529742 [Linnemannia gamsii]